MAKATVSFIALFALVLCACAGVAAAQPAPSDPALIRAAYDGDVAQVTTLLAGGAKVDARAANGDTALIWAADRGHLAVAELLLKNKAGVDTPGAKGFTPLNWAAYNGHLPVVKLLVENKANINAQGNTPGYTPLMNACGTSRPGVVAYLLERGADVRPVDKGGYSALAHAAASYAKLSYEAKSASYDIIPSLIRAGGNGTQALFALVKNGKTDAVMQLLVNGVNVNATDSKGETALFKAAAANDADMVNTLLASNANPNIAAKNPKDRNITTPLMYAAYHCSMSMVQALLNKGVNRSATNPNSANTAYWLAQTGWTKDKKICSKDVLVALSTGCYGSGCPGLQSTAAPATSSAPPPPANWVAVAGTGWYIDTANTRSNVARNRAGIPVAPYRSYEINSVKANEVSFSTRRNELDVDGRGIVGTLSLFCDKGTYHANDSRNNWENPIYDGVISASPLAAALAAQYCP